MPTKRSAQSLPPIALASLIVLVLGGCGGSREHKFNMAQGLREVKQEEARVKPEEERIKKAEQREARKQREQENAGAEIERTEASFRAEQQARENSPSSHHYPAAVRAGFVRGCDASTGHEDSACRCAIKRIEAKVALGRYRENEHEIEEGQRLPLTYSIQYGYCVGSEAVAGG
jgi:hypothetical protein